ncbi:hypothetical protein F5I97DRAFT_1930507 [Phlebopus sp. FC_14]|nr:hypothetical protein F5I97DRAFT_1930507 [Phlebopus sp. FC_14]
MTVLPTFTIIYQQGITGGFAPPTPTAIHALTRDAESPSFTVTSKIRPLGTPTLQDAGSKSLSVDNYATLLEELQGILSTVPPQYPGVRDLYGLDTSIILDTQASVTATAVPYGSYAAANVELPTEEQKGKFKRAVDIITQEIVGKA